MRAIGTVDDYAPAEASAGHHPLRRRGAQQLWHRQRLPPRCARPLRRRRPRRRHRVARGDRGRNAGAGRPTGSRRPLLPGEGHARFAGSAAELLPARRRPRLARRDHALARRRAGRRRRSAWLAGLSGGHRPPRLHAAACRASRTRPSTRCGASSTAAGPGSSSRGSTSPRGAAFPTTTTSTSLPRALPGIGRTGCSGAPTGRTRAKAPSPTTRMLLDQTARWIPDPATRNAMLVDQSQRPLLEPLNRPTDQRRPTPTRVRIRTARPNRRKSWTTSIFTTCRHRAV